MLILYRKSKIRKAEEVALGPKYAGSRVSRKSLQDASEESDLEYEDARESQDPEGFADPETVDLHVQEEDGDIDSDNAFGESDTEKFKDFTFRGSANPRRANVLNQRTKAVDFMTDSEDEDEEDEGAESLQDNRAESDDLDVDMESNISGDEDDDLDSDEEKSGSDSEEDEEDNGDVESGDDRAELRKIMNEEKSVVATISQAVKADVEKGKAIKKQRQAFDSLLNVRIRLQKALVATNSMAAVEEKDGDVTQPYQAAEEAAIKLLNTLNTMRRELEKSSGVKAGTKRKRAFDAETPSSLMWQRLQDSESTSMPTRQATLEKWSSMVHGRGTMPISRKLNTTTKATITEVLQEQLSNSERLVKRTHMPRSCAPIQVKQKLTEDPNIYDDADFYQLLLKELVDQRMMDSSSTALTVGEGGRPIAQWTAVKEAKTKKNVDTKASKGRKMRFTVHEKLQNFMAPEDRSSWEQDAVDRFFGTLLGQKMSLGEEEENESGDEDDDGGEPLAEEALMLFRS